MKEKESKGAEKSDVARREEEMLAFWREHDIFNKSIEKDAPHGDFVFYDGPPFATGTPHYGHILAGTIKDAIPRFWTMNGYRVPRKWGWDCHGLPLENIIEKRLGLSTKRDIEEMGVKKFNEAARDAVLEYEDDWKVIVPRMGRFVDMEDDYKTMDATYTESVWWVFSELNRKGLVYEGFKSMHLCPRCGTTLSNFEVNQGYKDIKDIAVTVKLPLLNDVGNVTDTSLLVWTTTPWTLPGNMAAAVHNDIDYTKVKIKKDASEVEVYEYVILAKARLAQLGTDDYEVVEEMKGSALVGKSYLSPFDSFKNQEFKNKENAWKIYHADYVELGEEGTGAVHLAPAYGEEDMELAKRENVPIVHHVGEDGRFKEFVTHLAGQLVKPKDNDKVEVSHLDADIEIVKLLKANERLIRKENITHSYPHCWRCETPLLNYATTSWFVRVTDIKDKLVEENNKVHWVPEHVGRARFGHWLEGARDWAVSRQRYWGAPIPIWRNEATKEYKVIGSLKELQQYVKKSENRYFIMRHGESELNTQGILNGLSGVKNGITEKGKEQTCGSIEELSDDKIDIIYYSPLQRTKETADLVSEALGVDAGNVFADERIREMKFGEFEEKRGDDYHAFFGSGYNCLIMRPEGGESWTDVKKRVGEFLYEINTRHEGKNILIIGHNGPLQMMQAVATGEDAEVLGKHIEEDTYDIKNAEVREFAFTPMPHNDKYELDFHRPYIDEIELHDLPTQAGTDGTKLVRIPDVFDCWFESGSMPYAQNHYPFENKDKFDPEKGIAYPAQFIAEGLDQTRGWFYSLIVLGTALFGKSPFENVIVSGLALAEDGKKMSKSLQNYPDPMELTDRVGADAIRFYLLSSPIIKAEDLSISEKEILEQQRKNLGRLHNVLAMYEMYADENTKATAGSTHVLDAWIIARTHALLRDVTLGYKNYELDRATRPVSDFIDDVSVWYLRRSRERLKQNSSDEPSASFRGPTVSSAVQESTSLSSVSPGLASESHLTNSVEGSISDKTLALQTLKYVLRNLSLVMAPVMPFYAEYLFKHVAEEGDRESVHLMAWPEMQTPNERLILDMAEARRVTSLALELRAKANIKVRQPLASLKVRPGESGVSYLYDIIRDEVNVKEIVDDPTGADEVWLDIELTDLLRREGNVRELIRNVQEGRKTLGLNPQDRIVLTVDVDTYELLCAFEAEVKGVVGASQIMQGELGEGSNAFTLDGTVYHYAITKE